jgi:hypothetical protein
MCDFQALESIFEASISKYTELHPSQSLDPADADRAIAELREDLRL